MIFQKQKYSVNVFFHHQYPRDVPLCRKIRLASCERHVYILPQGVVYTANIFQPGVEVIGLLLLARLDFRVREDKVSWSWMFASTKSWCGNILLS